MQGAPLQLREHIAISPEQGVLFARAMLGGLAVPGYPTALQYDVITQVAHHVAGCSFDITTLEPIDATTIATVVTDGYLRRRLVQCVVALELLADPSPELARHVRQYARTLGVEEPMVNTARRVADGQLALMYADIQRNSYYTEEAKDEILQGHFWRLLRSKFAYSNVVASRAIERKWAALADMPAGSLGWSVAEFYRIHHFPLPGARRGIGEVGAQHDFVHVLADYPPSPEGEIDVFAFIAAAMWDPKGFVQLVMTLGLFQNATITRVAGKKVAIARSGTLEDPGATARFGDALRRGRLCRVDALGIDHFAIADQPLEALREQFDIPPREDTTQPGALDAT